MKAIVSLTVIMLMLVLKTQAGNDKKDVYQVYVNAADHSVKAHVLTDAARVSPKEDRTYHWYAFNKIMGTKGGFEGKLLHGEYVSFYLDNNLKEKGFFKKGLKHGKWITWYMNGKIRDITHWNNGLREGSYRSFTENSEPVLEASFKNDKLHGKMISYENGKILSTKKYNKGEEVIPPVKKEKAKREKESGDPEKTREQEKIKSPKKTKEGVNTKTIEEKKTFRDKWKNNFARKGKESVQNEKNKPTDRKTQKGKKGEEK